jgi:L-2-hydroxycarboxylate dehydrogenase (NAD+)
MIEESPTVEGPVRMAPDILYDLIRAVFLAGGLQDEHARMYADVLVSADLLGIRSHGVARLPKLVDLLKRGAINIKPVMKFRAGSDTTGVLDADHGPGVVAANMAMNEALLMAEKHGTGFVAVFNSSHLGYPGYYARKAMKSGFIGLCMSNGGRVVTPTFGMEPFMGSNPISVAIPGRPGRHSFYLDMATSSVAVGKIETYLREGREIPKGWIPEAFGSPALNEQGVFKFDMPLLPLGGEGTDTGGHKGYALSLMVELLCSLLTGQANPATGHFLGAINIKSFREPALVYQQMAETFDRIKKLKKAPGRKHIYIPGELEAKAEEDNRRLGISVSPAVLKQMRRLNAELALGFAF